MSQSDSRANPYDRIPVIVQAWDGSSWKTVYKYRGSLAFEIDVSDHLNGIYFIRINTNSGQKIEKLTIKR